MSTPSLHRIDTPIVDILSRCTVAGNNIALPPVQLDRKTYDAVNKVLEMMGGKWNRSAKAHVFRESPFDLLDTVVLTAQITDVKKLFQLYETPESIADYMVDLAGIRDTHTICEPSAGPGRIVRAILKAFQNAARSLTIVEKDRAHMPVLEAFKAKHFVCDDFTQLNASIGTFDRIIMNPPFTRGQDIAHIHHAVHRLNAGGIVVAISSNGPRQQDVLRPMASKWEVLPAGTFSASGTDVTTALMVISA